MKIKSCIAVAAAIFMLTPAAMAAKDQGTKVNLQEWGIVTVPNNIYIQGGTQPALTAQEYGNDMARLFDTIYHATPRTYQLIEKDGASFQYGYMLHYSLSSWDMKQILDGQQDNEDRPDYLQPKTRMDLGTYVNRINSRLRTSLPMDFSLVEPMHAVKTSGKNLYEGTVCRHMRINGSDFKEMLHVIAWQRSSIVDIAVVMGSSVDESNLTTQVTTMLERAKPTKKIDRNDF